ncbi:MULTISPECIES: DNA methyltransferase [Aerosakkonema]|uniref:DNA methyltransferase n=1 Tax=Aerosakkonema TaxID=1246629 RepID=UPI0035BB81D8
MEALNTQIPLLHRENELTTINPYSEGIKAIEDENFPFEQLSIIAEQESWRKEINRPIYYIHKWWARRLGSVFRAIIISTFAPQDSDIIKLFYQPLDLKEVKVFDPFMGSGTTIGEAIKLGATVIGRDINPVAHFLVKNALIKKDKHRIIETFEDIKKSVSDRIQHYYTTILENGEAATVLYYFWVKYLPCPFCTHPVDLFSSYIFSKHAYPNKFPQAQAICPKCENINTIHYTTDSVTCHSCHSTFNPQIANVKGQKATCKHCNHTFSIAKVVQQYGKPPEHRMYAKLVLLKDGSKQYLPINEYDLTLYESAKKELSIRSSPYPIVAIKPGYNTDQVLNYCYRYWHEMFNERQLLCLSVLSEEIKQINDLTIRDLFICLFSGTLEFNNMFASFKGEGTGAVRHLFSHHILKPERTPLEANLWGTAKSSGSFSTLFESRILKAIDYCEKPFEIKVVQNKGKVVTEKLYGLSPTLALEIVDSFDKISNNKTVYLGCGDSAKTDIPTESIDAIITDPPFFDNVHYSQLADFFYVWQRYVISDKIASNETTRHPNEVQSREPAVFAERLQRVFSECYRVLKSDGLMVFTYHHSKAEGWQAILRAIVNSGLVIIATHPIKSEMSVATPKSQANSPIDLDIIIVCRKRNRVELKDSLADTLKLAVRNTGNQVKRFNAYQRHLSRNDVMVVFMAQVIKQLSWHLELEIGLDWLETKSNQIQQHIEDIYVGQKKSLKP